MKCLKVFRVDCARGWYQVAKGQNGTYFCREYGFNGYAMGFTRWEFLGKIKNIEKGESKKDFMINFEKDRIVVSLRRISFNTGYRLPNIA